MTGGGPASVEQAFHYIDPYFDHAYATGTPPVVNFNFTPYTFMVDLENGEMLGKAGILTGFTTQRIIKLATQAADE